MQPDTNRQGHASRAGRARGAGPCCPSGLRAAACLPSPQRASAGPRPEPRGTGQVYLKEKPYEEYNGAESYVFGAGRALRCAAPPPPLWLPPPPPSTRLLCKGGLARHALSKAWRRRARGKLCSGTPVCNANGKPWAHTEAAAQRTGTSCGRSSTGLMRIFSYTHITSCAAYFYYAQPVAAPARAFAPWSPRRDCTFALSARPHARECAPAVVSRISHISLLAFAVPLSLPFHFRAPDWLSFLRFPPSSLARSLALPRMCACMRAGKTLKLATHPLTHEVLRDPETGVSPPAC